MPGLLLMVRYRHGWMRRIVWNLSKFSTPYSCKRMAYASHPLQTVDKALLLQGFAIVGTAFLI